MIGKALIDRVKGWINFALMTLLVDAFLIYESTLDVRIYGIERLKEVKRSGHSPLLTLWHGQGLLPIALFRNERLCLYASHTREENYARSLQAIRWWTLRLIERLGYQVLDASQFKSESRGVMQFVDLLRKGTGSVIAADGPAGPIFQAKPGPAFLSKKAGVMLVPIGTAIDRGFRMDQWDRFEIPWPFAEVVVVVGEPILVPSTAKDDELERFRVLLENEMNFCSGEARRRLSLQPVQEMQRQRA